MLKALAMAVGGSRQRTRRFEGPSLVFCFKSE